MKKIQQKDFIARINKIFKNKYDTSHIMYVNSKTKVMLICPLHEEFYATPNHLLDGHGCPYCANKYVTTKDFVEKAKKVHDDKYDYSKVDYKNNTTKVCIICKEHGEFWQTPSSHLNGNGCPKCNGGVKFTLDEFIKEAKLLHNDFYDYSQVEYINARTKVKIICPRHGEFWQTPEQHLRGQGCPKCKSSRLENIVINKLKSKNIHFIYQAHIGTLGLKTVDFYLPNYKVVIECQGEQHFTDTLFSSKLSKVEDRILLDEEKYAECCANNLDIYYFTIPEYFKNKNTKIDIPFYNDKKMYTQLDEMINDILQKPTVNIIDKWSNLKQVIFSSLPNTIETNHGYQLKNRMLFLYDSSEERIQKSLWRKYYKNRAIKVKFIDFQEKFNENVLVDWLKDW